MEPGDAPLRPGRTFPQLLEDPAAPTGRAKGPIMKTYLLKVLLPGVVVASALAYAASAGAQTPGPGGPAASATPPPAARAAGHHEGHPAKAGHHKDMVKAECQAMMAKRQEMQAKLAAMDADLDRAVAEMNAAKGSKTVDALEKPMMAVINELVAQHRAERSMMMEMQPAMMAHMMKHMKEHGGMGSSSCPMMKGGGADSAPKADVKTPKP